MEIKALIFDLDGVIVDTAKYHYIAWKKIANDMGFEFSEHDNERLKGVSRMTSLEILLEIGKKILSDAEKHHIAEIKNNIYLSYITKMEPDEILPGVEAFLKDAKKQSFKLAIGSASKNTPIILERIGLTKLFDAIVDGNVISNAKPDPEVFLKGAELLEVKPQECIVFEDSVAGIEAAKRGNMFSVGIGNANTLKSSDLVISSFENLSINDIIEKFSN